MKFSIKYFISKCDQILSFLWIWSHLLNKFLLENFIFFVQWRNLVWFTSVKPRHTTCALNLLILWYNPPFITWRDYQLRDISRSSSKLASLASLLLSFTNTWDVPLKEGILFSCFGIDSFLTQWLVLVMHCSSFFLLFSFSSFFFSAIDLYVNMSTMDCCIVEISAFIAVNKNSLIAMVKIMEFFE